MFAPCINSIKILFVVPTDAHYYKIVEMLKQFKNYDASNDFKSVYRIKNKLTKRPPTKLKETQTTPKQKPNINNRGKIGKRP
jgi:hypothetical protein